MLITILNSECSWIYSLALPATIIIISSLDVPIRDDVKCDELLKEAKEYERQIKGLKKLVTPFYKMKKEKIYDEVKARDNLKRSIKASIRNFLIMLEDYPKLYNELKQLSKTTNGKFKVEYPDKQSEWHISS